MTHKLLCTVLSISFASLAMVGCVVDPVEEELTGEETAALSAAVDSLSDSRGQLPVTDEALVDLAIDGLATTRADVNCEKKGVVAGVWYDLANKQVFQGAWFKLGSGDFGGTVYGAYGDGDYDGTFDGPELTGDVMGKYHNGYFLGRWEVTSDADADGVNDGPSGELAGRYERRNEVGGYFFGWWGDCSFTP